jgi:hypothetical protein
MEKDAGSSEHQPGYEGDSPHRSHCVTRARTHAYRKQVERRNDCMLGPGVIPLPFFAGPWCQAGWRSGGRLSSVVRLDDAGCS